MRSKSKVTPTQRDKTFFFSCASEVHRDEKKQTFSNAAHVSCELHGPASPTATMQPSLQYFPAFSSSLSASGSSVLPRSSPGSLLHSFRSSSVTAVPPTPYPIRMTGHNISTTFFFFNRIFYFYYAQRREFASESSAVLTLTDNRQIEQ